MEAEQERCLQEGKVSHRAELLWAAKYLSLTLLLEFQQVIHFVSLCFTLLFFAATLSAASYSCIFHVGSSSPASGLAIIYQ